MLSPFYILYRFIAKKNSHLSAISVLRSRLITDYILALIVNRIARICPIELATTGKTDRYIKLPFLMKVVTRAYYTVI